MPWHGSLRGAPADVAGVRLGGSDDGRITLPCDTAVMEYAMCLLRRGASAELEQAFLSTMAMPCHYARACC
ncbi:hypothetical protein PVAP13_2NG482300 [Panicum virgatum]|jgi:hypothetical protein|uniref:Uncharacterized protein n=1 Tax=Panicum virgatum TaxID=38727 RepID=A0A8T0VJQ3_PANVG|nr:hypothetical protein PVAP13_2NG482300 [Panicum virgatum]